MARLSGIGVGMNEWEGRKPAREIEIFNSQAKLSICRKKWMQHLPNLMSPAIYDASVRASLPQIECMGVFFFFKKKHVLSPALP